MKKTIQFIIHKKYRQAQDWTRQSQERRQRCLTCLVALSHSVTASETDATSVRVNSDPHIMEVGIKWVFASAKNFRNQNMNNCAYHSCLTKNVNVN
jgi:hypothetical protein